MAIRNRDGSIYEISKPNPIRRSQNDWNMENVVLWNMKNLNDSDRPSKYETPVKLPGPSKKKESSLDRTSSNTLMNANAAQQKANDDQTVECFAVSYERNGRIDSLYGDRSSSYRFYDQKTFHVHVIRDTDLSFQFTTKETLELNTIIFPKDQSSRWYKIDQIDTEDGTRTVLAVPSDITPTFSK